MTRLGLAALSLCLSVSVAHSKTQAENWPQYRGPDRTGIVTEKNLAQSWPDDGPKELWRKPTGIGFASPIAADGKLFLFYLADGKDVLEAFDAQSGNSLWKQALPTKYSGQYPGTRCTPVIQADRIYTYGADARLTARSLGDGQQLWSIDLLQETNSRLTDWGNSSSPLVDGDMIYIQVRDGGNAAVCVDKTGKVVWKSQATGGSYASPVMADVGGTKMLLCFANEHLIAINPKDGKTLWELNESWETEYNINSALPVVHDGKVFLSCAYRNAHCGLYQLSPTGATRIWGGKQITARFQAPILDNGYLYANSEGILKCVKWDDGKIAWSSKPADRLLEMGGPIVRFGEDKMICLNSGNGQLSLIKATPQGMEKIKTLKRFVEGDQLWATPLIYNGKLYIKAKEDLIAYDMTAK